MKRILTVLACSAAATMPLAIGNSAFAAVPNALTQQGRLLNAQGNAVTTAQQIVFTIYDAATAGTVLWTETQTITPDDGYFSARLGDATAIPATLFNGATRYLSVKVGADAEMTPRQPLVSVPYALMSNNAVGDITPNSISINGTQVIDATGHWVGPASSLAGPTGPAGPAGATGPAGSAGAQGPAGPTGSAGAQGPAGPTGPAGSAGAQGPAGPTGPTGSVGAQGPTGPAGSQGPAGSAGAQGARGATGPSAAFARSPNVGLVSFNTASGITNITSVTFTAPSAGYVIAIGSGYCNVSSGGQVYLWPTVGGPTYGTSDYSTVAFLMGYTTSAQGSYAVNNVYSVGAGQNTVYLNASSATGGHSCNGGITVFFSTSLL